MLLTCAKKIIQGSSVEEGGLRMGTMDGQRHQVTWQWARVERRRGDGRDTMEGELKLCPPREKPQSRAGDASASRLSFLKRMDNSLQAPCIIFLYSLYPFPVSSKKYHISGTSLCPQKRRGKGAKNPQHCSLLPRQAKENQAWPP